MFLTFFGCLSFYFDSLHPFFLSFSFLLFYLVFLSILIHFTFFFLLFYSPSFYCYFFHLRCSVAFFLTILVCHSFYSIHFIFLFLKLFFFVFFLVFRFLVFFCFSWYFKIFFSVSALFSLLLYSLSCSNHFHCYSYPWCYSDLRIQGHGSFYAHSSTDFSTFTSFSLVDISAFIF